ncbi:MAG: hypothetical protein HQL56_12530 [Magnetococcales bacterium]|nr:hypothetical protein [Magnetococcales bacterium]
MPILIFAGLTLSLKQRIKSVVDKTSQRYAGWHSEYCVTTSTTPGISDPTDIASIMDLACRQDSVLILGFSRQDGKIKQKVASKIKPYFRFRWFDNAKLPLLQNSNAFADELCQIVQEEDKWRERVMPKASKDPLLLPRFSFRCKNKDMWEYASSYGDPGNIESTLTLIEKFRKEFSRSLSGKSCWVDSSELVYDYQGPRHGKALCPNTFKYSSRLEEGFHYDVRHFSGRAFNLTDADETIHYQEGKGYLNIDPHGHVR